MEKTNEQLDIREVGLAVREVTSAIAGVMKSEVELAKAELKDASGKFGHHAARVGIFAGIAAAGIFPFMAFLVIGIGEILSGNYWLSSLIVSLLFFAVGGGLAYAAYKRMRDSDYTMPETRHSISDNVHHIGAITKRRQA